MLLGTAASRDGSWLYRFDDVDLLWTARAIWGEIPPRYWDRRHAVTLCYAMLARFWMLRDSTFASRARTIVSRPPHEHFWEYVRAYSQPVSPDWLELGTNEEQERRQKKRQTTPWSGLPGNVREVVSAWMLGQVPPSADMVGMVHWLATRDAGQADAALERRRVAGVNGNAMFCVRGSSCSWRTMPVVIRPPGAAWADVPVELVSLSPATALALP